MKRRINIVAGSILAFLLARPALAGQAEDGVAAYQQADYAKVLEIFRPLAEKGDPKAETFLGLLYLGGQGVKQDYDLALDWLQRAAGQGYAHAQYDIGTMFAAGLGVPHDNIRALMWFDLAAAQVIAHAPISSPDGVRFSA